MSTRCESYQVGVPQTDDAAQGHLSHQQVVHPAEGELQVLYVVVHQVGVEAVCDTTQHGVEGDTARGRG